MTPTPPVPQPNTLVDTLFEKILTNTYTLNQIQRKIRLLKEFINQKLFTSAAPDFENVKPEDVTYVKWLKTLDPTIINQFTSQNANDLFRQLDAKVTSLKVLLIYVAFDIPDSSLTLLGGLLRGNYGPQFVFDIRYDPSLIGGAALVWNGVYKDYSVKKSIEDNKQAVLQEIQTFFKH